ncbi:hypothetical protein [Methanosarcina horonobensis]|uniref:hypothetical protein n=1 Tax=Methanosarcina horonobensis TaxID=418008 RepID=UPI000AE2DA66|nr:hypothetical protein [Methanosarcina horonobensis]
MEPTASDWVNFWNANVFAVITDNTKPAMKWAASELKKRGKKVYVVDLSDKPAPDFLKSVSELPVGLDRAIIGITKSEPGDLIPALKEKGAKKSLDPLENRNRKSARCLQRREPRIPGRALPDDVPRKRTKHTWGAQDYRKDDRELLRQGTE